MARAPADLTIFWVGLVCTLSVVAAVQPSVLRALPFETHPAHATASSLGSRASLSEGDRPAGGPVRATTTCSGTNANLLACMAPADTPASTTARWTNISGPEAPSPREGAPGVGALAAGF